MKLLLLFLAFGLKEDALRSWEHKADSYRDVKTTTTVETITSTPDKGIVGHEKYNLIQSDFSDGSISTTSTPFEWRTNSKFKPTNIAFGANPAYEFNLEKRGDDWVIVKLFDPPKPRLPHRWNLLRDIEVYLTFLPDLFNQPEFSINNQTTDSSGLIHVGFTFTGKLKISNLRSGELVLNPAKEYRIESATVTPDNRPGPPLRITMANEFDGENRFIKKTSKQIWTAEAEAKLGFKDVRTTTMDWGVPTEADHALTRLTGYGLAEPATKGVQSNFRTIALCAMLFSAIVIFAIVRRRRQSC